MDIKHIKKLNEKELNYLEANLLEVNKLQLNKLLLSQESLNKIQFNLNKNLLKSPLVILIKNISDISILNFSLRFIKNFNSVLHANQQSTFLLTKFFIGNCLDDYQKSLFLSNYYELYSNFLDLDFLNELINYSLSDGQDQDNHLLYSLWKFEPNFMLKHLNKSLVKSNDQLLQLILDTYASLKLLPTFYTEILYYSSTCSPLFISNLSSSLKNSVTFDQIIPFINESINTIRNYFNYISINDKSPNKKSKVNYSIHLPLYSLAFFSSLPSLLGLLQPDQLNLVNVVIHDFTHYLLNLDLKSNDKGNALSLLRLIKLNNLSTDYDLIEYFTKDLIISSFKFSPVLCLQLTQSLFFEMSYNNYNRELVDCLFNQLNFDNFNKSSVTFNGDQLSIQSNDQLILAIFDIILRNLYLINHYGSDDHIKFILNVIIDYNINNEGEQDENKLCTLSSLSLRTLSSALFWELPRFKCKSKV